MVYVFLKAAMTSDWLLLHCRMAQMKMTLRAGWGRDLRQCAPIAGRDGEEEAGGREAG